MVDWIDHAAEQEQLARDAALAARPIFQGTSLTTCEDCGNPIPHQRQQAIAGVRLCIDCQAALEVCNR